MLALSKRWETKVTFDGVTYHVRPHRYTRIGRDAYNEESEPYWAAGVFVWSQRLSWSHPKNERQLKKAIARCNKWCTKRNVNTLIADDVLSRLRDAKVLTA